MGKGKFSPLSFHTRREISGDQWIGGLLSTEGVLKVLETGKIVCLCRDSNTFHNQRQKLKWRNEGNVSKQVRQIRKFERERITFHMICTQVDSIRFIFFLVFLFIFIYVYLFTLCLFVKPLVLHLAGYCSNKICGIWYDIFNCNWVATRWQ
jgi:hypothetical protein